MDCTKCGYPNIEEVKLCANCGNDLTKAIVIANNNYIKVIPSKNIDSAPIEKEERSHYTVDQNLEKTISQNFEKTDAKDMGKLDLTKTITDKEYNLVITGQAKPEEVLIGQNSSMLKPTYLKEDVPQYNPIEFEDNITVVRGNSDPGDTSISSHPHARISKKEGKWILENLASNKAVFVQVVGEVEIQSGTIVLIGSEKFYEFVPKSELEE